MATRLEREKRQVQNDHYKNILAKLIAKEENKYCADCLAKGKKAPSTLLTQFTLLDLKILKVT